MKKNLSIVLPYKSSGTDELKYCLRSLENIPHGKVFIAGDNEPWFSDEIVHLKKPRVFQKYLDAELNWITACKNPDVTDDFIAFNDDFFVMEEAKDVPTYHLGTLQSSLEERLARTGVSSYTNAIKETIQYLKNNFGIEEPLNYSAHIPMIMNKRKRLIVSELCLIRAKVGRPLLIRSVYGNLFLKGGKQIKDVKVYDTTTILDTPFVSTDAKAFTSGEMGRVIKDRFKEKSRYER